MFLLKICNWSVFKQDVKSQNKMDGIIAMGRRGAVERLRNREKAKMERKSSVSLYMEGIVYG